MTIPESCDGHHHQRRGRFCRDDYIDITIPKPLSAARDLARGELGGPDSDSARLMAVLLMRVFGISDMTPEEFIVTTGELEALGLLTDLIERRS